MYKVMVKIEISTFFRFYWLEGANRARWLVKIQMPLTAGQEIFKKPLMCWDGGSKFFIYIFMFIILTWISF